MAPRVWMATRAWPPSWYAVNRRFFSVMTALLRSAPIMIRSLANSSAAISTALRSSVAALSAATLTRFARSAPENPGVPLAITYIPSSECDVTERPTKEGYLEIDVLILRDFAKMRFQYLPTSLDVRIGHIDVTIKSSRSDQRPIQRFRKIRRRQNDDPFIRLTST